MSVSAKEREHEEARLDAVLVEIRRQLTERHADTAKYRALLTGTQEFLREEKPRAVMGFEDLVEVAGGMQKLKTAGKLYKFSAERAKQLERLEKSPYFARIDFRSDSDGSVKPIYIGISSLMQEETGKHVVYDWRAPVSSMYYDYELGPAQYEAPLGVVSGELLLKRHFRIVDGRLVFMFDNSLTIYDEMLQEALQAATGDRMRSIVNTIQREQNRIIRGESRGALVVQGSAGSGKTVIALHRAAYLLYKHRTTMNAKSILMFSPGGMFVDYTSPVLPELGEEPVTQTSFGEFGAEQLRAGAGTEAEAFPYQVESLNDQLEFLLENRDTRAYRVRSEGIRLKSSDGFAALLIRYAAKLTESAQGLGDVTFRGKTVMSSQEASQLLRKEYAYLPLEKRVAKIKRRVNWLLDEVVEHRVEEVQKELSESEDSAYLFAREIKRMARIQAHQEVQAVRDKVAAWRPVTTMEAYKRLFKDERLLDELAAAIPCDIAEVRRHTLARLGSGTIPYEDLAPVLLLHGLLEGFPDSGGVRHVIVDEVQDYSPVMHEVLHRSFPGASFTLLGDVNQSMNLDSGPATSEDLVRKASAVYGSTGEPVASVVLSESYRSTREITEFSRAILAGGEPVLAIERPGELPSVRESAGREALARAVASDVADLARSGLSSIAIVCKTARESWAAFDALKAADALKGLKVHLVRPGEKRFRRGIVIIPSYLAKGLEFEAVVIYDASENRYVHESDRRVLYTACTRALHKLHLHYAGSLSPFIAAVDPTLYQKPGPA
ncbi:MAG: RNA polymerase recycling motor HelD [Bacillota bacterium]